MDPHDLNDSGYIPARLVPGLLNVEPHQEGLPRVIHPIGVLVGSPDPTLTWQGVITAMADNSTDITVKEDAVYVNDAGDPIQFRKGQVVTAAEAADFPDLRKGDVDPNAGLARPQAERDANQAADEEAGLFEERMVNAAPQNRAERAPSRNRAAATPDNG